MSVVREMTKGKSPKLGTLGRSQEKTDWFGLIQELGTLCVSRGPGGDRRGPEAEQQDVLSW